jgi:hypothetical protein
VGLQQVGLTQIQSKYTEAPESLLWITQEYSMNFYLKELRYEKVACIHLIREKLTGKLF